TIVQWLPARCNAQGDVQASRVFGPKLERAREPDLSPDGVARLVVESRARTDESYAQSPKVSQIWHHATRLRSAESQWVILRKRAVLLGLLGPHAIRNAQADDQAHSNAKARHIKNFPREV